jgi:Uma2 family endonuclease
MSIQPKPHYSFEDYLSAERECIEEKHQDVAGQVFAMTGATYNHNLIATNLASEVSQQLKSRPCTVLANDMRLRIEAADACLYPEVVVLCDTPTFHDSRKDVLTNATLVAEVLSNRKRSLERDPSTEGYDRGGKFAIYRGLPSLVQYILITQDRLSVDCFTRQADGRWVLDAYTDPDDCIGLESIGCTVPLREIYDKVRLDSDADAANPR